MSETILYRSILKAGTDIDILLDIRHGEITVMYSVHGVVVRGLVTGDLDEATMSARATRDRLATVGEIPIHSGYNHVGTLLIDYDNGNKYVALIAPNYPEFSERFETVLGAFMKLRERKLYISNKGEL